jgi:hypothetical protein
VLIATFICFVPVVRAVSEYLATVDIKLTPLGSDTFAIELENSAHTPLNALEFELRFDPEHTHIDDIALTEALCEERFIITKYIDNVAGSALVQCGTVTPFLKATGTVALITGTGAMPSFGTTTHVLAHDGYGTDATRALID